MFCSVKQSAVAATGSDVLLRRRAPQPPRSFLLPSLPLQKKASFSLFKPLHVAAAGAFGHPKAKKSLIKCEAYEADKSKPIEKSIEVPQATPEAAKRVKIGIYFATWWALNVVFNIYNKKVLNAYPYPWLTSTLSLACGSLIMLISWALRIAETPKTDFEFWKTLFPVSAFWPVLIFWSGN